MFAVQCEALNLFISIAELYNPLPATLRATDPDGKLNLLHFSSHASK